MKKVSRRLTHFFHRVDCDDRSPSGSNGLICACGKCPSIFDPRRQLYSIYVCFIPVIQYFITRPTSACSCHGGLFKRPLYSYNQTNLQYRRAQTIVSISNVMNITRTYLHHPSKHIGILWLSWQASYQQQSTENSIFIVHRDTLEFYDRVGRSHTNNNPLRTLSLSSTASHWNSMIELVGAIPTTIH